jgi:flagellar biosynthetic protein FlhB
MSDDSADKTFEPTERKKEEFRKQGRFAKSKDAGGVVATAAVIAVIAGSTSSIGESARRLMARTVGDLGALERVGPLVVLDGVSRELMTLAGSAVLAAVVAAIVISLAQARFTFYPELLSPDVSRLDPTKSIGRLFSPKRAATDSLVALLRVGAAAAIAWHALSKELPMLVSLARMPLEGSLPMLFGSLARMIGMVTGVLFLVAVIDYAQSWFTLSREMMMSRQEREDEAKQSDGDPKAKARMKARARALAKKRAMNAVKNADVIVTNPTHVAVALRYGPRDPAPVVIAKGHDDIALRIRAEARKHGIPILENRRLARALDAEVAIGKPVPAAHFAAVARVLAFVYKLRGARNRKPSAARG